MRNSSDKSCRENQNTHSKFTNVCLWDGVEKYDIAGKATNDDKSTAHALSFWITKAIDTHSEYVTLTAFPRQQRLSERASMLGLYVNCIVRLVFASS
jgi:hypothetical protein